MKSCVIVGGGVSGLAAAWRLKLLRPETAVTVLEASARLGGKLISEHRDGFIAEAAADGFLARKPPVLDWARELGLEPELIEPRPEHRFSQVYWNGVLHPLPEGFSGLVPADPDALRRSALLSPEGAERAARGIVQVPEREGDESVSAYFTRRYGAEAFERLMEPLLAGIYAGDADALSLNSAFPSAPAPAAPGPAFRSFAAGMARLPERLAEAAAASGVNLVTGAAATSLTPAGSAFEVGAGTPYRADAVVVALPPRRAGELLAAAAPSLASVLSAWPVSSVANLNLAFGEKDLPGLPPGSGFVVPKASGLGISAATWSSRKWPGRAPEGGLLVRLYFGGARDPEGWRRGEDELLSRGLDLIETVAGARPRPLWHRVFRWQNAFAQPNVGHAERHRLLDAAAVPGLVLAGGYFAGVGIPDCLARAEDAARAVDRFLSKRDSKE